MQISEINCKIDASDFDHLFILFLNKQSPFMVFAPIKEGDDINKAFEKLRNVYHLRIMDEKLYRAVVITHNAFVASYPPSTFRWLCGLGPHISDSDWLG